MMRIQPLVFATWLAAAVQSSRAGAYTPLVPKTRTMTQTSIRRRSNRCRFLASNNNNDTSPLPTAKQQDDEEVFVNQGAFSFMEPYLDIIGFKPGRQIVGAIPQETTVSSIIMTEDEAQQRRRQAEMEMVNISTEERQRRQDIAQVAAYLSALYLSWATLIVDDGDVWGHVWRFAAFVPLVLAWGFYRSGQQGL